MKHASYQDSLIYSNFSSLNHLKYYGFGEAHKLAGVVSGVNMNNEQHFPTTVSREILTLF